MTRLLLAAALMAAFFLSPLPTAADVRFARLSEPGIVAILRHAFAPGTGDPASFKLDDCTTQRNLDARGREQMRRKAWISSREALVFPRTGSANYSGSCTGTTFPHAVAIPPARLGPRFTSRPESAHTLLRNRKIFFVLLQFQLDSDTPVQYLIRQNTEI